MSCTEVRGLPLLQEGLVPFAGEGSGHHIPLLPLRKLSTSFSDKRRRSGVCKSFERGCHNRQAPDPNLASGGRGALIYDFMVPKHFLIVEPW